MRKGLTWFGRRSRLRLMKAERFAVVERADSADAVLTGVAGVERKHYSTVHTDAYGRVSGGGGTSLAGMGVLRLVDTATDETIWVFEYKRALLLVGSASSRVANKTVEQLLKDAKACTSQVLLKAGAIPK